MTVKVSVLVSIFFFDPSCFNNEIMEENLIDGVDIRQI